MWLCGSTKKKTLTPTFNDFHPRSIHSWFAQTKLVLSSDFPYVIQKIKRGVISRILLLPIQPWFAQTSLVFSCAFPLPIQQLSNSIEIWLVRTTLKLSLCLLHPSFICCTQASWCTQASKCASKLRKLGYLASKLRLLVQAHMAPLIETVSPGFLQQLPESCLPENYLSNDSCRIRFCDIRTSDQCSTQQIISCSHIFPLAPPQYIDN